MDYKSHPNYELFEELGSSSASTVMRAFDRQLERYVAIKMLNADSTADASRRKRFFQGARFLANLAHPNVLPVYALEESQGWMVMELMAASMKDRLSSGPVSAEIAKSILAQTFEALKYIHSLGRIHGSIRPSNILISDTGMVKLSDFSDRKPEDGLDAPALNLSKYVPPEVWDQHRFGQIGKGLDFYSLGITIVESLAGKPLELLATGLNRQNSPEIEWARWHTSPDHERAIAELLKSLPGNLQPVLIAMLRQNTIDRAQSAEELIKLLGSTKFVAVDLPLDIDQPKGQLEEVPTPQSASLTSPTTQPSPFNTATYSSKSVSLFSDFDLKNPKTFRIVAAITLTLAALFGLALQSLMAQRQATTPFILQVEPATATITINGENVEAHDGKLELDLIPQKYVVKATLEGHVPAEVAFEIAPSKGDSKIEKIERKLQLVEFEIPVAVELNPEDAELLVEGEVPKWATSQSPDDGKSNRRAVMLRPGKYAFTVQKEGFVTKTSHQTITRSTKQLRFDPLSVEFIVLVDPPDSKVSFSDAIPIEGKKNVFAASPGKHSLIVSHSGYETSSQEIEVSSELRSYQITLNALVAKVLPNQEKARRLWLYARPITRLNPQAAINDLDEAILLDPQLSVAFRERAIAKNELNELDEAEADIVDALQGLPNDYSALKVGGIVAARRFQASKDDANLAVAMSRLNAAIADHPQYSSARFVRSQLLFATGKKQQAQADLDALVQMPLEMAQVSIVKSLLGTLLIESGDLDSGNARFKESIDAADQAGLSITRSLYERATAIFSRAEEVEKSNPSEAQKLYAIARTCFRELLTREDLKSKVECWDRLALAEVGLKNYQDALNIYTNLIEQGVITSTILKNRASCYEALGNKDAADNDRKRASLVND
jgi:serine/threonine protein kinase/tetratricopeptide (TPR) repeat protein